MIFYMLVQPAADAVLHRFDLLHGTLTAARAALAAGDTAAARAEALAGARRRLAAAGHAPPGTGADLAQAEGLLERRLALLGYPEQRLAEPIDWLMMRERDDQWTQHLGYFKWVNSLARSWRATGRREFARAWAGYVSDLVTNCSYGRPGWRLDEARPRVELGRRVSDNGEAMQWNSLAAATRVEVLIDGLALVLDAEVVDDALLLQIIDHLWRDAFACLVNNPRTNTPNQYLHTSVALLRLGIGLPEHLTASAAYELGANRLRDAVARQVLADGSDLEQSPNYNYGILRLTRELAGLLPPDLRAMLREAAGRRLRFLAALHYPDGIQAEIAKCGPGVDQRAMLADFGAELGAEHELVAPGRAFPWGGWYALRSAWAGRGSYLLLKACPPGAGHVHEDALSLVLWCGGRRLLLDSANFSYGSSTDLDRRMNAYSAAGAAHSGLHVDGEGPRRKEVQAALRGELWEEPSQRADAAVRLPNRALAGRVFALVEGTYDDGYGAQAIPVRHHRRILQVEGRGWLVIDRCRPDDGAEHAYALRWMLPPDAVGHARVADGVIHAPGLAIVPMTPAPATCELIVGREDPPAGWYFPTYGQRQPKPDAVVAWRGAGAQLALTWLADTTAPAIGTPTIARAGLVNLTVPFADGAVLRVACADGAAALEVEGLSVQGELLAVLGADAVSLGERAQAWRRAGPGWQAEAWPPLPVAQP